MLQVSVYQWEALRSAARERDETDLRPRKKPNSPLERYCNDLNSS
jgi:hypothetical protein